MTKQERIDRALDFAFRYGGIDGAHHKAWVIDQMVRALTGCPMVTVVSTDYAGKPFTYKRQGESKEYAQLVSEAKAGEDGLDTYEWDEGIPPQWRYMMRKGRMENWQEVNFFGQTRIYGNVYECDAFEEGEGMMTNELVKYHTIFGATVAETRSGSMYTLGKPADKPLTLKEIFAENADTKAETPNLNHN